ncbi:PadR family transcriptional regulator [Fulvivirga lutimaris]|uniref:PadR family transcriptional regulator n=1 Tax=Fulvivirga lutimaris TaxID=1819566 RepID=UPI0012BBD53F|nr:helix-turn-helix transcriptional regulator [Fulvivirga lutimaris]
MKGFLGEFEELVLLTIATLGNDAYGVAIKEQIQLRANRSISIGALHSTISRLEDKGYLNSHLGGATAERGGRKKRFFELTEDAKLALGAMKSLRDDLWNESQVKLGFSNE